MSTTGPAGLLATLMVGAAMFGACSGDGDGGDGDGGAGSTSSAPTTEATVGLESTSWVLAGWSDGTDVVAPSAGADLEFSAGGQLSGSTGCNSFGGTWESGDDSLAITLGPMTLAGCVDPVVADQEQAIISAMEMAASFEGGVGSLSLLDADGNVLLEYGPVSGDLAGTSWRATGINDGNESVTTEAGTPLATIEFEAGGTAVGSGGCNGYGASWASDGEEISITELEITEMSCGEELDALEQRFVAALGAATTFSVSGTGLELRDDDGALQVAFEPIT